MCNFLRDSLFYCFNCGNLLKEGNLGFIECQKCYSIFIPIITDNKQCLMCVSDNGEENSKNIS